jgi:hypothetical protein
MVKTLRFPCAALLSALLCGVLAIPRLAAQDSKVMGELKFDKKVLLMPGKHVVTAKQSGYTDFVENVVVEPGQVQTVRVKMSLAPGSKVPDITSQLKLTILPKRGAVFLDDNYVGHAGELGGAVHSLPDFHVKNVH